MYFWTALGIILTEGAKAYWAVVQSAFKRCVVSEISLSRILNKNIIARFPQSLRLLVKTLVEHMVMDSEAYEI